MIRGAETSRVLNSKTILDKEKPFVLLITSKKNGKDQTTWCHSTTTRLDISMNLTAHYVIKEKMEFEEEKNERKIKKEAQGRID